MLFGKKKISPPLPQDLPAQQVQPELPESEVEMVQKSFDETPQMDAEDQLDKLNEDLKQVESDILETESSIKNIDSKLEKLNRKADK